MFKREKLKDCSCCTRYQFCLYADRYMYIKTQMLQVIPVWLNKTWSTYSFDALAVVLHLQYLNDI